MAVLDMQPVVSELEVEATTPGHCPTELAIDSLSTFFRPLAQYCENSVRFYFLSSPILVRRRCSCPAMMESHYFERSVVIERSNNTTHSRDRNFSWYWHPSLPPSSNPTNPTPHPPSYSDDSSSRCSSTPSRPHLPRHLAAHCCKAVILGPSDGKRGRIQITLSDLDSAWSLPKVPATDFRRNKKFCRTNSTIATMVATHPQRRAPWRHEATVPVDFNPPPSADASLHRIREPFRKRV